MSRPASTLAERRRWGLTPLAGVAFLAGLIVFLWFAPEAYSIYKAVHVLAAVVWVGGGAALMALALRADRAIDNAELAVIGRQAEWVGTRVFTPASFVVLGFGIAMIEKGGHDWGQFWVLFALVGWAISAATGILFLGPKTKILGQLYETRGPDDPDFLRQLRTVLTIARFDAVLLLLIVVDMTAKPFV